VPETLPKVFWSSRLDATSLGVGKTFPSFLGSKEVRWARDVFRTFVGAVETSVKVPAFRKLDAAQWRYGSAKFFCLDNAHATGPSGCMLACCP